MKTVKRGDKGDDVKLLQRQLHLMPDGIFGPVTEETVKAFQSEHGLLKDGIVGAKTWAALGVADVPCARKINKIIIHCSATAIGKDYTVQDIRQWHLARGFADIGYHYVIYRNGVVMPGRALDRVGAHCTGQNANSIGVCYIGGCAADGKTPMDTRTDAQKVKLRELVQKLRRQFPGASVHGHREFANKACPSFDVKKEGL